MSAMPFLVHSEVWGDFLPEASASSAGLLWLSTLALTVPPAGPGDREDCIQKVSMGEGELALKDAHLWLRFSCFGRVGGTDKWQAELRASVNTAL